MRRLLLLLLLAAVPLGPAAGPALAVTAGEASSDPALEARARVLFRELRCMVCQNQSIDDSDALLAKDLRMLVRERLAAGDSEDEIRRFLVERYGAFVLLTPPADARTILLWGAPILLLLGGGFVAVRSLRRRAATTAEPPLAPEEIERLRLLLADQPDPGTGNETALRKFHHRDSTT